MKPRRRLVLLALTVLSISWSIWVFLSAGPLAVSEATLELLGDIFQLAQTSQRHGQGEHAERHRSPLMPMSGSHPVAQTPSSSPVGAYNDPAKIALAADSPWDGFSDVYVLSLPQRSDRRISMERVHTALPWLNNWTYVDATSADDTRIGRIHDHVRRTRDQRRALSPGNDTFTWPEGALSSRSGRLGHTGADLWSMSSLDAEKPALASSSEDEPYIRDLESQPEAFPLTCASRDYASGPPYTPALPPYMILAPSKLACWYSHVQVLRTIAERYYHDGDATIPAEGDRVREREVALILEDDVDVERDLHARMETVWRTLPDEWDMLFLGHCWSNESHYAALPEPSGMSPLHRLASTSVHPSRAPKCTHAYAVTRAGARKLVEHLRFVPFAYSRALDQAYAWLVLSGRVKSYSVVPSLVVQRKVASSDIDPGHAGVGSEWRESLENGVF